MSVLQEDGALDTPPAAAEMRLLRTRLACVFALFSLAYWLFVIFSDRIIAAKPASPSFLINPWFRAVLAERDGLELPIATAGMVALVLLCLLADRVAERLAPFQSKAVQLVCFLSGIIILARNRTHEFSPVLSILPNVLMVVGGGVALRLLYLNQTRITMGARRFLVTFGFVLWTAVVVLALDDPSIVDFDYFIGPALKLLQGDGIGSTYMQYGVLGTILIEGMMWMGLQAHQMQLLWALIFAAWFLFYYALARELIRDGFIRLLFFVALVLLRFFAIQYHPAHFPQVNVIRLDLWVPLVLAVKRWGFSSARTASAFALVYLADALFGALFLAVYLGFEGLTLVERLRRPGSERWIGQVVALIPILCALAVQWIVFGSLVASSAKYIADVTLMFLPISLHSLFWTVALGILVSAVFLRLEPDQKVRRLLLFILFVTIAQLVYFFGRSHDHNLLNISGSWLLVWFLGLERASTYLRSRTPHLMASGLVILLAVMVGEPAALKLDRIQDHLVRRVLIDPHPIEQEIEQHPGWPRADPQAVTLARTDAYLNYRLGLRQFGPMAPFEANVFIEDTARWLYELAESGHRLWSPDPAVSSWVRDFNETQFLRSRPRHFVVSGAGSDWRVTLSP